MRRRQLHSSKSTFSLAGWLFADLLLALSMVFIIAETKMPAPVISATFTQSFTPTKKLSSTPLPPPTLTRTATSIPTQKGPVGLGKAQCYNLWLSSSAINEEEIVGLLREQLPNNKNSRAGLVFIWANGGRTGNGIGMAQEIKSILTRRFSNSFSNTVTKSLYFNMEQAYFVQLEVYFFTDAGWESGYEKRCVYNK